MLKARLVFGVTHLPIRLCFLKASHLFVRQPQTGTLALLSTLPEGTGVFSPACLVHCLSGQNSWNLLEIDAGPSGGATLGGSLAQWYFNGEVKPPDPVTSYPGNWRTLVTHFDH